MIHLVRKLGTAQAIQVKNEQDRQEVLTWLREMNYEDQGEAIEPLVAQGFWFLRDEGSKIVYVSTPEEFEKNFQVFGWDEYTEPPKDQIPDEFKF